MLLLIIAWSYVVLMMAVVEATSRSGTLLGALFTLLLYGALPLSIVVYLMRAPARAQARKRGEQVASESAAFEPDGGSHPASDPVAPKRKEP